MQGTDFAEISADPIDHHWGGGHLGQRHRPSPKHIKKSHLQQHRFHTLTHKPYGDQ